MKFEHPLARSAKAWPAYPRDGESKPYLVVVTTLTLDPDSKKYKTELVEQLKGAVNKFLTEQPDKAVGFVLMNKPKH